MDTKKPFLNKRVYIRGPEWDAVANAVRRAMRLTAELNKLSFDDDAKVRELFGELIGQKVDETFTLNSAFLYRRRSQYQGWAQSVHQPVLHHLRHGRC